MEISSIALQSSGTQHRSQPLPDEQESFEKVMRKLESHEVEKSAQKQKPTEAEKSVETKRSDEAEKPVEARKSDEKETSDETSETSAVAAETSAVAAETSAIVAEKLLIPAEEADEKKQTLPDEAAEMAVMTVIMPTVLPDMRSGEKQLFAESAATNALPVKAAENPEASDMPAQFTAQAQSAEAEKAIPAEIVSAERQSDTGTQIGEQRSFFEAISTVKRQLAESDNDNGEAVDVEALQAQLPQQDAIRGFTVRTLDEGAASPIMQTADGITDAVAQKSDGYVIHLKPEGLGEITVHLSEDENGQLMVSLTAQNDKTAELLKSGAADLGRQLGTLDAQLTEIRSEKDARKEPEQDDAYGNPQDGQQEQHRDRRQSPEQSFMAEDEQEKT